MENQNIETATSGPTPLPTTSVSSSNSTNEIKNNNKTSSVTVTNIDDPSHPLYQHRRIVSDFEYGDILGEGSYSTVILGKDKKTNKQYAVKKLDKAHIVKNDKVKYVMIERDALSRMNHPGIVKLYWTFRDNRSLYYVLDLAPNGELYTFIRKMAPFDIETARFYASEILLAMEHIHNKEVIHRDIKPENILLDENMHIKITDFGSAKILSNDTENAGNGSTRSFVGTAEYVSPELLRSEPTLKGADWWAFGCVLFQMISGRSPFKAATDYLIFQNIKNLDYEYPTDFPEVAKDLVEKLLVLNPEKRLGSDEMGGIDVIKNHPFFEGIIWDNVFGNMPLPLLVQKYLEELKYQQLQQKLLKEQKQNNNEDDEDDFENWFNGNDQDYYQSQQQQQQQVDTISSSRQRRYQRYQAQQQQQQLQQLQLPEQYQQLEHPLYDPQQGQLVSPLSASNHLNNNNYNHNHNNADENPFSDHVSQLPPHSPELPHPLAPLLPNVNNSTSTSSSSPLHQHQHSSSDSSTAVNLPHPSTSSSSSSHVAIKENNNVPHSSSLSHQFLPSNSTKSSFSTTDNSTTERLGNQSHPPWMPHLYPSESIVRAGKVTRRRGLFSKKRYLVLTDRPRLLYLDEGKGKDGSGGGLRCEISWNSKLLPELKGRSVFTIHTPQKSYTFEVHGNNQAQDWVNTINTMLVDSFGLA
ncbi:kinase-like domain-containing protein [Cunninghamella echinulata]|nr:kinase-like domain-containing protein [Cunninghamella echinulata]